MASRQRVRRGGRSKAGQGARSAGEPPAPVGDALTEETWKPEPKWLRGQADAELRDLGMTTDDGDEVVWTAKDQRQHPGAVADPVERYRPTTRHGLMLAAVPDEIAVWRPKGFQCQYGCKGVQLTPVSIPVHVWDCPWWVHEGKTKTPF